MFKRTLCVLTAVCMAVLAAGCSGGQSAGTKAETVAQTKAEAQEKGSEAGETAADAAAETWAPEKDITFVVPFEAGGAADIPARIVAKYMDKYCDKAITVVNMPGSGGRIGAKEVMRSEPDGYTIMHVPVGWYMQYATGVADFSYEDFENITMWCDSWVGLVVNAESPYQTYEDFIAAAKEGENKITVGAVTGTLPVLAEMAIEQKEGVKFNMVDFGTGAKAPELLGGRVDAYVDGVGAIKSYVDGGQFRCLAVFAHEPVPSFPDVPTVESLGYTDFDYLLQSFGMWAPKGTPEGAVNYYADLVRQAAEDPECQAELEALGYGAVSMNPEDYAAMCKTVQDSTTEAVKGMLGQ